jgi:hypothetical protein
MKRLDDLLSTYNLISIVNFPARIVDKSITRTDNIFIGASWNYTIKPHINGLSDHDAQIFTISNLFVPNVSNDSYYIRSINKDTIAEFQLQLSWERWDDVFIKNYVNSIFSNFLKIYLRYYHSSFPKKEKKSNIITSNGFPKV